LASRRTAASNPLPVIVLERNFRREGVTRGVDDEIEAAELVERLRGERRCAALVLRFAIRRGPAATTVQPSARNRTTIAAPMRPRPPATRRAVWVRKDMFGMSKTEPRCASVTIAAGEQHR